MSTHSFHIFYWSIFNLLDNSIPYLFIYWWSTDFLFLDCLTYCLFRVFMCLVILWFIVSFFAVDMFIDSSLRVFYVTTIYFLNQSFILKLLSFTCPYTFFAHIDLFIHLFFSLVIILLCMFNILFTSWMIIVVVDFFLQIVPYCAVDSCIDWFVLFIFML